MQGRPPEASSEHPSHDVEPWSAWGLFPRDDRQRLPAAIHRMTPHDLGLQLRQLVLRDRLEGRSPDPRRLQAAIGDLCGGEHGDLVAPLRSLVLSAAFASAAGQDPPLGDPRLLGRLQQELAVMYAAPLCQRLQPVLEGLLGLAPTATIPEAPWAAPTAPPPAWMPSSAAPGAAAPDAAVAVPVPPRRSRSGSLNVLLAFVSGMLLMALAGIGLWLQQRPQQVPSASQLPPAAVPGGSADRPPAVLPAAAVPKPEVEPGAADPASGSETHQASGSGATETAEALDRSLASVNALYGALSAKDYGRARSLFGAGAADQFEPAFFDQFERVTVQDLRLTSQTGATVNLEGVVSFFYPDGTVQSETRSFTLDSGSDPPLIIASAFGRVIKPR